MTPHLWPQAKAHLSKHDKILRKIISAYSGEMLVKKNSDFFTLARAIVGQQISVKAADSVWARLEQATKIEPLAILQTNEQNLRACGLSARKVEYVKNIADFFLAHDGNWCDDDEQLTKQLCAIKGVGRWTAEMFMIFHLHRPDVLPLGDIGLLKAFELHYGIDREQTAQIEEFAEIWRPYRSVATWYLWRSLDPHPVEY